MTKPSSPLRPTAVPEVTEGLGADVEPDTADAAYRLRQLLRVEELLAQASREIGPSLTLQGVLSTVLATMRGLVTFRGGSICLVEGNGVHVSAADPPVSGELAPSRVPIGRGLAGWVVAHGETLSCADLDIDDRFPDDQLRLGTSPTSRSYLGVPLVCLGEIIGVLQVDATDHDAFGDDDIRLLEGLASQVAGVIESARRYEAVMELERLKSDFVARVSHELRTPLAIMAGFISTLRRYGEEVSADERHQILARMEQANDRLTGLIEQLLSLARLEAGGANSRPTETTLRAVLERVRDTSLNPAEVTVLCADGIAVTVDPHLLEQGLGLIVDNALKYAGDAEIRADERSIVVRDHGPGLPQEVRRAALEPFTRGHLDVPGLGIGLAMARSLLALGAGEMRIGDAPGGGTEVHVELGDLA